MTVNENITSTIFWAMLLELKLGFASTVYGGSKLPKYKLKKNK